MQKDELWWAPVLGVVVTLTLLCSLVLIAFNGWPWFGSFLNGQAANWAQAFGSVIAIAAAYRIGHSQIEAGRVLEARRRSADEVRQLLTIDAMFGLVSDRLHAFEVGWRAAGPALSHAFPVDYWQESREALAKIDPFLCPTANIIPSLVALPGQLHQLAGAMFQLNLALGSSNTFNAVAGSGVYSALAKPLPVATVALENQVALVRGLVDHARALCAAEVKAREL